MGVMGRKNCILYGTLILALSTLCFGLAGLFDDLGAFFTVSFLARGF